MTKKITLTLLDVIDFIKTETRYEELTASDKFSYGALVKYKEDYDLLSEFAMDNRDVINMCFDLFVNERMSAHETNISRDAGSHSIFIELFDPVAISLSAVVAFVGLCGCFYELCRRSKAYQSVRLV